MFYKGELDMTERSKTDHDLLIQIAGDLRVLRTEFESNTKLIEERCERHQRDTAKLTRTMSGNGWLGIKSRVEIMWYSFGGIGLLGTGWLLYKLTRG